MSPPTCCIYCQSQDIKSAALVYKMGTGTGSMLGVTLSGDIGYATTKNKSTLAEEMAPPKRSKMGCLIFIVGFMLAGATDKAGFLPGLIIILTAVFYFVTKTKRDNEYNEALRAWSNKWLCMKCGNNFVS